jgi:hypothetical protein
MVNYSQCKIFELYCMGTGRTYVGGTISHTTLIQLRFQRSQYKKQTGDAFELFQIAERLGQEVQVRTIKEFPCNNRLELQLETNKYIKDWCVNRPIKRKYIKDKL